jgi:hypothetical protein
VRDSRNWQISALVSKETALHLTSVSRTRGFGAVAVSRVFG